MLSESDMRLITIYVFLQKFMQVLLLTPQIEIQYNKIIYNCLYLQPFNRIKYIVHKQKTVIRIKGGRRMKCPFCNQDNTRVVDSRPVEDTNSIRRRRLCDACGRRFTTYEKVESIPLTVIKKDQNREQYNRSKIQSGILRACYKRPISIDKIEEMMDAIEGEIFNTEEKEISSTRIGEIVMEHLKDLDAVAYVRFASVYREFKDVSTFMDELKKFMN